MPWIIRNADGRIIGVSAYEEAGAVYLADDAPEVVAWRIVGIKATGVQKVAVLSSAARDAWRTPGKDAVYQRKLEEGAAWKEAGQPADLSAYPHIAAEVGITATSAAELVALWDQMARQWATVSANIEAKEQASKKAIKDASDEADVAAVLADLKFPKPEAAV